MGNSERKISHTSTFTDKIAAKDSPITVEFQRRRAREMSSYYVRLKQATELGESKLLGWNKKNEILNGRWVMMGIAIGLLTEYATTVNIIDQIKLTLSYLGLSDTLD